MEQGNRSLRKRFAEPLDLVIDPADWTKTDFAQSYEWIYTLGAEQVADLDRAVAVIERGEVPLAEVEKRDFSLPVLGPVLEEIRHELLEGRGFALIRGVPVERYSRLESAIAFWGIGRYMGEPVSQNAKGHLLGHVTHLETSTDDPVERGYYTARMLPFHVDGVVDIVGLLCLKAAKSGGESALVSTIALHNEMLRRRPDLVALLVEPIYRDRRDEVPEGAEPYYRLPVFNYYQDHLSTSYGNIRTAQRFEELPRHSPELKEALALFDSLARELCLTMAFQPGDLQLLNNHVVAHSRLSAVEDHPEPWRKRHLLRLRMMTPDGRPVPPAFFALHNISPDAIQPGRRHSGAILAPGVVFSVPLYPE